MKFTANVSHQSTRLNDDDRFKTVALEGDDIYEIARRVAQIAARRRFGDKGTTSNLVRHSDKIFRGFIGQYRLESGYGVTNGVGIIIRLDPVKEAYFSL